jgi:hypothetical protein
MDAAFLMDARVKLAHDNSRSTGLLYHCAALLAEQIETIARLALSNLQRIARYHLCRQIWSPRAHARQADRQDD